MGARLCYSVLMRYFASRAALFALVWYKFESVVFLLTLGRSAGW
jgi:hypothetical protein